MIKIYLPVVFEKRTRYKSEKETRRIKNGTSFSIKDQNQVENISNKNNVKNDELKPILYSLLHVYGA